MSFTYFDYQNLFLTFLLKLTFICIEDLFSNILNNPFPGLLKPCKIKPANVNSGTVIFFFTFQKVFFKTDQIKHAHNCILLMLPTVKHFNLYCRAKKHWLYFLCFLPRMENNLLPVSLCKKWATITVLDTGLSLCTDQVFDFVQEMGT